jgi:phosphoribosylformylglycinamidine cyclo-ligase
MKYSSSVDYSLVDPLKILMQKEGKATAKNLEDTGFKEVPESRGESAYVLDAGEFYLAFVQEGLGTKSLVADGMKGVSDKTYYDWIAQDTVAAIINDLITVGATPLVLNAYWSMNSYTWFGDKKRAEDLIKGWAAACNKAGVTWGGGETQSLNDIVKPGVIELAGSAIGKIPKDRFNLGEKLTAGDTIILFESTGIHANGISLARDLAKELPDGYSSKLPDGTTYGEALLQPSPIYSPLIQSLYFEGIDIHYMAHITGHGWRKIMRHASPFTYRLTKVPPVPSVLQFIHDQIGMTDEEAYATFNMGAGFAIFVKSEDAQKVIDSAVNAGIKAYNAGVVEEGPKQVIIEPKKIVFSEKSLQVR